MECSGSKKVVLCGKTLRAILEMQQKKKQIKAFPDSKAFYPQFYFPTLQKYCDDVPQENWRDLFDPLCNEKTSSLKEFFVKYKEKVAEYLKKDLSTEEREALSAEIKPGNLKSCFKTFLEKINLMSEESPVNDCYRNQDNFLLCKLTAGVMVKIYNAKYVSKYGVKIVPGATRKEQLGEVICRAYSACKKDYPSLWNQTYQNKSTATPVIELSSDELEGDVQVYGKSNDIEEKHEIEEIQDTLPTLTRKIESVKKEISLVINNITNFRACLEAEKKRLKTLKNKLAELEKEKQIILQQKTFLSQIDEDVPPENREIEYKALVDLSKKAGNLVKELNCNRTELYEALFDVLSNNSEDVIAQARWRLSQSQAKDGPSNSLKRQLTDLSEQSTSKRNKVGEDQQTEFPEVVVTGAHGGHIHTIEDKTNGSRNTEAVNSGDDPAKLGNDPTTTLQDGSPPKENIDEPSEDAANLKSSSGIDASIFNPFLPVIDCDKAKETEIDAFLDEMLTDSDDNTLSAEQTEDHNDYNAQLLLNPNSTQSKPLATPKKANSFEGKAREILNKHTNLPKEDE